jgi:hypothetical protein
MEHPVNIVTDTFRSELLFMIPSGLTKTQQRKGTDKQTLNINTYVPTAMKTYQHCKNQV